MFLYLFKDQKEILAKIFLFPFLVFSSYKLSFLKNYLNLSLKKNVNQYILMIILFFNYRFIYSTSFIYIFLSNRVNPSRANNKLGSLDIRTRIQDAIYKAIDRKSQKDS